MIAEDYFDVWADPSDFPNEEGVICQYCGDGFLTWRETDNGWRLFDDDGDMHLCRTHEPTADDFPAVP